MNSTESGIQATRDLGKYLGMPILQKRINKDTFTELLERANSRLAGWKGRVLSLAGRITLTKLVLSSLHVHSMSTIFLPKSTLNALDKISRNFIWNITPSMRKQHLVGWDRICRPKGEGELGIRPAEPMNKALIAKIGWRILHDVTSLWARVLRSKYKVGEASWFVAKGTWSSTWRSIGVGLREVVIPGLSWILGDGSRIKFWKDKWLCDVSLEAISSCAVPDNLVNLRVRELWIAEVGWDFNCIEPFLPSFISLNLRAMMVDLETGATDRITWGPSPDGNFSVAYALAS